MLLKFSFFSSQDRTAPSSAILMGCAGPGTLRPIRGGSNSSKPLFEFRNYGQQLLLRWSTISNEAAFGTDDFIRVAVARSTKFINSPIETKNFYQDLDANGARLSVSMVPIATW